MSAAVLPWHIDQWQQFYNLYTTQRLGHANFIVGDRGIGKRHFSRAFIGFLLCNKPDESGACGKCHSCQVLASGVHPDFHELTPDDGSSVIGVDDVRKVSAFSSLTAQLGENKIILIHPAEALNINAANALLKNLEEPQKNTYFFLVGEAVSRLPATVRSRCQIRHFIKPAGDVALAWLQTQALEGVDIAQRLDQAQGRPLLLLDGDESWVIRQAWAKGLLALASSSSNVVSVAEQLSANNLELSLQVLISISVDLCKKSATSCLQPAGQALVDAYGVQGLLAATAQATALLKLFHAGQHPNAKLCLETLLIDLQSSIRR